MSAGSHFSHSPKIYVDTVISQQLIVLGTLHWHQQAVLTCRSFVAGVHTMQRGSAESLGQSVSCTRGRRAIPEYPAILFFSNDDMISTELQVELYDSNSLTLAVPAVLVHENSIFPIRPCR
jgi:hypothetical protein